MKLKLQHDDSDCEDRGERAKVEGAKAFHKGEMIMLDKIVVVLAERTRKKREGISRKSSPRS